VKIAFVTDLHIREDRLAEHTAILEDIADSIRGQGCEYLILGGDLCGRAVPHRATPAERNLLLSFINLCDTDGVLVVRGNHDDPGDWEFLNHIDGFDYVSDEACLVEITDDPVRRIIAFPWMDRGAFDGDWERSLNRYWGRMLDRSKADLIVAHAAYEGGAVSLGQPDLPTKDPIVSGGHQVKHGIELALLGHYHAPHEAFGGEHRAIYGGASFVNEFGEDPKRGWTCVDWPDDGGFTVEHWLAPQPLRVVIEADPLTDTVESVKPALGAPRAGDSISKAVKALCDEGHHVRVQVTTANEAHAATIREGVARLREEHGSKVTAKITIDAPPAHREGAMEVASAASLGDKIRAFAGSLKAPPKPRVVERAIEILEAGVDPLGGDHGDEED